MSIYRKKEEVQPESEKTLKDLVMEVNLLNPKRDGLDDTFDALQEFAEALSARANNPKITFHVKRDNCVFTLELFEKKWFSKRIEKLAEIKYKKDYGGYYFVTYNLVNYNYEYISCNTLEELKFKLLGLLEDKQSTLHSELLKIESNQK